jgi:hypothetical protein
MLNFLERRRPFHLEAKHHHEMRVTLDKFQKELKLCQLPGRRSLRMLMRKARKTRDHQAAAHHSQKHLIPDKSRLA